MSGGMPGAPTGVTDGTAPIDADVFTGSGAVPGGDDAAANAGAE